MFESITLLGVLMGACATLASLASVIVYIYKSNHDLKADKTSDPQSSKYTILIDEQEMTIHKETMIKILNDLKDSVEDEDINKVKRALKEISSSESPT